MPSPRPDGGLRLYVRRVGDDDPKACTGRRLLLRGHADPPERRGIGDVVVLDPYADSPLAPDDRRRPGLGGVFAVDCSWNRLSGRGRFDGRAPPRSIARRLPWLLAANPQHFGRPTELNTAEALAAALYLLGEPDRAEALIAEFPGGRSFVALNAPWMGEYAAAADGESVRAIERRRFGGDATADRTPAPPSRDAPAARRPSRRGR